MPESSHPEQTCVIIGASHAGVNLAFNLRRKGWLGPILLFDADPALPYHRPPLSKAYLSSEGDIEEHALRPWESYEKADIQLNLGIRVSQIHRQEKRIILEDGSTHPYDKLVLATGARPLVPPIPGLNEAPNLFLLRTAQDIEAIRSALLEKPKAQVVIIGGGYIGLETSASLRKLGVEVQVLEREARVLARVTAPEVSAFYQSLHQAKGVEIHLGKNVTEIQARGPRSLICCEDGREFMADLMILGVGIRVNLELAQSAGLALKDGIKVDESTQTSDPDIFAIGDCTYHYSPHYDRFFRLESVQNAVDQAKVASMALCGEEAKYDSLPWFWSDQYEIKLQIAGLNTGYDEVIVRKDHDTKFSVWYFQRDTLLAVDAINDAKAYVLGTRFIKGGQKLDKEKLADPTCPFKPAELVLQEV
ncbi:MAG: FAD-dependent oxidoreductase [Bacteroidota bacterium]